MFHISVNILELKNTQNRPYLSKKISFPFSKQIVHLQWLLYFNLSIKEKEIDAFKGKCLPKQNIQKLSL